MDKRSGGSETVAVGTGHGLADVAPAELAERIAEIDVLLDRVRALLAGAVQLDDLQRKTIGRLRGAPEVEALDGVLEFAAAHEPLFVALADEDEGVDRTKFESALVRGRMANAQALSALVARLAQVQLMASDTALYATSLSRPIAFKAWEVAKVYVDRYPEQKALLAPAVNFYRGKALIAAKTRARNKAAGANTRSP